jgi:hypothetical protein
MQPEVPVTFNRKEPLRVVVTMDNAPEKMELLSPGSLCQWGRCRFLLNPEPGTQADFWIVVANARPADHMYCSPQNTMLIVHEPLEKKVYPLKYYRQFRWLIDSHSQSQHPQLTIDALGLCWHAGLDQRNNKYLFGYDHLASVPMPEKQNRISVVCSNNRFTPGQCLRLDFLAEAKRQLGDRIVHYGRGFKPVADKMDAMLPYRFHLALENCRYPNYFSEKIADAYLSWAFPVYVGCPNLEEFLPESSFIRIDPSMPDESIRTLRSLLDSPVSPGEYDAVAAGRDAIMNTWNPFAVWSRWAETRWQPAEPRPTTVRSHKAFRSMFRGYIYRMRNRISKAA